MATIFRSFSFDGIYGKHFYRKKIGIENKVNVPESEKRIQLFGRYAEFIFCCFNVLECIILFYLIIIFLII